MGDNTVSTYTYNPHSSRRRKARWSERLGHFAPQILLIIGIAGLLGGIALLAAKAGHAGLPFSVGLTAIMARIWWRSELAALAPKPAGSTNELHDLLPADILAGWSQTLGRNEFWTLLAKSWQARFIIIRMQLALDRVEPVDSPPNYDQIWDQAVLLAQESGFTQLDSGTLLIAWLESDPAFKAVLTEAKLGHDDLVRMIGWIGRLKRFEDQEKPLYGGFARDWAVGFAPLLAKYGQNFSQQIEAAGQQFARQERINQLDTLVSALAGGNGSVAIIGEVGIGKTALLYGLADHLLQSPGTAPLSGHQVIALNASVLLALADQPGSLERIMLALFSEANHAGNIIVALDEAQLFFGQGTGAVNLSQVLLPILQARAIRIVLTLTPGDWQNLKSTNAAMSSLVTPLILAEPNEHEVINLLADRALTIEPRGTWTTYQALREAYRLSGRFFQDEANPGRALKLLAAATNQVVNGCITDVSVQRAVEGQLGVKVEKATTQEADVLLHLEELIHERMINQTHAVKAVSAALRRSRAGVSSPNRPVGSFLFLGPTGVGKTELAKSLAAICYGSEDHMVRLDMSEYQQPADVSRLLEAAAENPQSFLTKVRTAPFCVVLLDEIEKAHPNILNLLLQMLDEGSLTDTAGKSASFKEAIVIATSNAGADEIRKHISAGEELDDFADAFNDLLISAGTFKPELINRFDDIILFRPLKPEELGQVVLLMIGDVNKTLANQDIKVELTSEAVAILVSKGNDPRLGARPMRRMIQRQVEDSVAARILNGSAKAGDIIKLDAPDVA